MRSILTVAVLAFGLAGCQQSGTTSPTPVTSAPTISSTVISLAINQLWPMAEAELNAYAKAHPSTVAGQAITKGLPLVSAEYAAMHNATMPATLGQFITAANTFIQAIPPGTIGSADLSHVQTIMGLVQDAVAMGLISASPTPVHAA